MARERMAKLQKYLHFENHIKQIIINFMIITKLHNHNITLKHRYLGSWPSDEETA